MDGYTPCIDPDQYGGVPNSSTTHALLDILHPIYEALDNGKKAARLLLVDFAKAYDHIDHNILLDKLKANGIPDQLKKMVSQLSL